MLQGLRTVVFPVRDLDVARAFYTALLSCDAYFDEPYYVGFDVGGYELGLSPDEGRCSSDGAHPYWGVDNVEKAIAHAISLGAAPLASPREVGDGIVLGAVTDPSGNALGFIDNPHFRVGERTAANGKPLGTPIMRGARVAASPAEVWALWTTSEGMSSWLTKAHIELAIGGPFELYFDASQPPGKRGSEGCRVLSFLPERMLSFSWNAPPHLKTRGEHTWVVLELVPMGTGTAVHLTHSGWPDARLTEGDWPATYAYFERAWTGVIEALALHCGEVGP